MGQIFVTPNVRHIVIMCINTSPLSMKINKSQRHLFGAVHLSMFLLLLVLHPWNGLQYNIDIHQYAITAALFGTVLGHHPIVRNHFALICVKITSTDELIEEEDYEEDVEGFLFVIAFSKYQYTVIVYFYSSMLIVFFAWL